MVMMKENMWHIQGHASSKNVEELPRAQDVANHSY